MSARKPNPNQVSPRPLPGSGVGRAELNRAVNAPGTRAAPRPASGGSVGSATPLLDRIDSPDDLKHLQMDQLPQLTQELRDEIVRVCSVGGLHLASSLGATDLIVALHYVLNSPRDKVLFDVGHQAYAHKMLTGRRHQMHTIKKEGGLSGFTRVSESPHDAITVGHASTSSGQRAGHGDGERRAGARPQGGRGHR